MCMKPRTVHFKISKRMRRALEFVSRADEPRTYRYEVPDVKMVSIAAGTSPGPLTVFGAIKVLIWYEKVLGVKAR